MPTFDGENLIITLDSAVTNIDWIFDVFKDWKDWMLASPLNRGYPQAFRSSGGDPLNTLLNQGAYIFLQNQRGWRIKPPEEDITIWAAGNLAAEDSSIDSFLPTDGAYTTQILGLQPITQGFSVELGDGLRYSSFQNAAWYDPASDYDGTVYPSGNRESRCSDFNNVIQISDNWGFGKVGVLGNINIGVGHDISNKIIFCSSSVNASVVLATEAITDQAKFINLSLSGVLDGDSTILDCDVVGLTYFDGKIMTSKIGGRIVFGGTTPADIVNCYTDNSGVILDFNGVAKSLGMPDFAGLVYVENFTHASGSIGIGLDGGRMILDSATVTSGTIIASGSGRLVDELGNDIISGTWNGGVTIFNELSSPGVIATAVWDDVDAVFLKQIITNKKSLVKTGLVWQLIIYDDDDSTPILTKDLKDKDGNNITDIAVGVLAEELQTSV